MSVHDKYYQQMKSLANDKSPDQARADALLCDLIRELGYGMIVEQYERILNG